MDNCHLISWNVAGWKKTHEEITRTYNFPTTKSVLSTNKLKRKKPSPSVSEQFQNWLKQVSVDILFLQETKLKTRDLAGELSYLAKIPQWETYWSCNDGKGVQRAGLNGVATFAKIKSPVAVIHADSAPLNDPELDKEGRCIMTNHGIFSVFNVYAPNTSGGKRLGYRLRFLSALRKAMCEQRTRTGQPVILVGDLNLKSRAVLDRHWSRSFIDINRLVDLGNQPEPVDSALQMATLANQKGGAFLLPTTSSTTTTTTTTTTSSSSTTTTDASTSSTTTTDIKSTTPSFGTPRVIIPPNLVNIARKVCEIWPLVRDALRARQVVPEQTRNNETNVTFQRFSTRAIPITIDNNLPSVREVKLGHVEHTEDYAWSTFEIDGIGIDRHGNNCIRGLNSKFCELILQKESTMNVMNFAECMKKLAKYIIPRKDLFELVETGILIPMEDLGSTILERKYKDSTTTDEFGFPIFAEKNVTSNACSILNTDSYECISSQQWLDGLQEIDGMIDSFAKLHPNARGRFTCWNQYQNGRGDNFGGRLDYIFVDEKLFNHLCIPIGGNLDCGYGNHKNKAWIVTNQNNVRSAKDAAVGGWNNAPTGGGGLPDGKPNDYIWHTTVPSHTGMIYTPPQWSDHIAVSFLMKNVSLPLNSIGNATKEQKKDTKICQPHKSVRSITSFFGAASASSSSSSEPPQKEKKKKDIKSFFNVQSVGKK